MKKIARIETTSASLHILAMAAMLCDHLWGTVVPGNDWLTCVGRLAFPIFSFMIVEGYFHTRNLKRYAIRLAIFALLSEIPFNLAMGSRLFYPLHQNVLWTFLMALGLIHWNEKVSSGSPLLRFSVGFASVIIGYLAGILTMADFYQAGVLTVLVFYFFRGRNWWHFVGQALCLWYLNVEMLSGFAYQVELFGQTHFIIRQGFALFALIPIWLYRGRQGHHSQAFRYFCYSFYPLHLLVLGLLKRFL